MFEEDSCIFGEQHFFSILLMTFLNYLGQEDPKINPCISFFKYIYIHTHHDSDISGSSQTTSSDLPAHPQLLFVTRI